MMQNCGGGAGSLRRDWGEVAGNSQVDPNPNEEEVEVGGRVKAVKEYGKEVVASSTPALL